MKRGEACNSTGVLTRLASSGEMDALLRDSIRALFKPIGREATPEMKTYNLKIFNSWAKLPFSILKHYDQTKILLCLTELENDEPCLSMG